MQPIQFKASTIIAVVSITSILLFASVLLVEQAVTWKQVGEILIHIGLFNLLQTSVWFLIKNIGWRVTFIQDNHDLFPVPLNIGGRYIGKIIREGERTKSFVLEVVQDFTSVTVYTYCKHSSTKSVIANITIDKVSRKQYLCFFWEGLYKLHYEPGSAKHNFMGYTILEIANENGIIHISGKFFSNKEGSGSRGRIDLRRASTRIKGSM